MGETVTCIAEKSSKIRVLAADSTRMNSQLLAEALSREGQLQVLGIEPKPDAILAATAQEKPHVIVLSSSLEDSNTRGFDLAKQIRANFPETRLVLLIETSKRSDVIEAFRSGAQGIFSRTEAPKTLAKCICSVFEGQVWANSAELRFLIEALSHGDSVQLDDAAGKPILSKREQDVVLCVAEGLSNREIATRLKLTEHTVKNYLFRIFDKLGVSSRVEVALYVFRTRRDLAATAAPNAGRNGSHQVVLGRNPRTPVGDRLAV